MENTSQKRIRVMLVDDEPTVLRAYNRILDHRPDIEIVAQATTGEGAVELAVKLRPDVILMDVVMKEGMMDGVEATKRIVAFDPEIKILALSGHSTRNCVAGIIKAGAVGYILKGGPVPELLKAIHEVAANGNYIGPGLAEAVVGELQQDARGNPALIESLTEREREVLRLVAMGHSSKEIALKLALTMRIIAFHREIISQKLKVHGAAEFTQIAIKAGLISGR